MRPSSCSALARLTLPSDLVQLVQRLDELLVGLPQGLDVHDTALGLLGNIDGALLEGSGVLAQQLVGGVGDGALGLHGLLAVGDA